MAVGLAQAQDRFESPRELLGERLRQGSIYRLLADEGARIFPDDYFADLSAPRGALTYPLFSGEGLEVISLGPVVHLASKEKGDNSMPPTPALVPRRWDEETAGPRDKAKAVLPEA